MYSMALGWNDQQHSVNRVCAKPLWIIMISFSLYCFYIPHDCHELLKKYGCLLSFEILYPLTIYFISKKICVVLSVCVVFVWLFIFYWFYMCRHCSLSCEIHLVNNMTMFWNVNFIFLLSHFIWKHCSKMCMYKCNPCWASNVDN